MNKEVEVTIHVPSDAQPHGSSPYFEHDEFIKFCKANRVDVNEYELECYEKNDLLYPCYRLLYPRELLRREFRTRYTHYGKNYKIHHSWEPLIELEASISKSRHSTFKEFEEAIEFGHPLDQAFERNNSYILKPDNQTFKRWNRYIVNVGKCGNTQRRESKVKHYYTWWKIFMVHDLKRLNTDEYNRVTGKKRGWGIINDKLMEKSCLNEFIPFYKTVSSFAYRESLLEIYYFERTQNRQKDWNKICQRKKYFARNLFQIHAYSKWVRFLRKLIENHERYRECEKIVLSLQAKSNIAITVMFLRYATGYKFEKICSDVSGEYRKRLGVGMEDGVCVYPEMLEKMFPDVKWDLEQNVKWLMNDEIKRFNSLLSHGERIPESLADDLFNDLSIEHSGTALAAIRKINKSYFDKEIWRENEVWSGVRDLAVSIEVHGKQWKGGSKLNDVLTALFPSSYEALKRKTGIKKPADAGNKAEFLKKIKIFQKKMIPDKKRCGRHLLIAHLTRNFSNHQKGLAGKELHGNLPVIYSALIRTLFVLYAGYKGV